jgi:hypothetical protein
MLRCSASRLAVNWSKSSVIGAELPSHRHFPHRGRDVLRLYRKYWGLVQRLPPEDQRDAAFRLRNEFRSKRHAYGEKRLGQLYKQALLKYEALRASMDEQDIRATGLTRRVPVKQPGAAFAVPRQRGAAGATKLEGVTVDGMWSALRSHGHGFVPNLRNVPESKRIVVKASKFNIERQANTKGNSHASR